MGAFQGKCARAAQTGFIALALAVAFAFSAQASYLEGFEQGGTFFGRWSRRRSHSSLQIKYRD